MAVTTYRSGTIPRPVSDISINVVSRNPRPLLKIAARRDFLAYSNRMRYQPIAIATNRNFETDAVISNGRSSRFTRWSTKGKLANKRAVVSDNRQGSVWCHCLAFGGNGSAHQHEVVV